MPEVRDQIKTQSAASTTKKKAQGLTFRRLFTKSGVSPYGEVEWELRDAQITDSQGGMIFEQKNVEVPKDWSMTATNIVASKYLHGQIGTDERETGVRQLVARVAETIRDWGMKDGYFRSADDAATFHDELVHLLIRQHVAFNSPVWFNVGCERVEPKSDATNWHWNFTTQQVEFSATGYTRPQCSACFINSVHDSLDSILTLAKTEGMLFKWGSGTGTNLSPLRSSTEVLSGGGTASGPTRKNCFRHSLPSPQGDGHLAALLARRSDRDFHILTERRQEFHETPHGEAPGTIAHEQRDVRLLDAQHPAGFGLRHSALLDDAV